MVAVRGIREVYAGAGGVAAFNVVQLRGFAWIAHSRSKNVLVVLRGMGWWGRLEVMVVSPGLAHRRCVIPCGKEWDVNVNFARRVAGAAQT